MIRICPRMQAVDRSRQIPKTALKGSLPLRAARTEKRKVQAPAKCTAHLILAENFFWKMKKRKLWKRRRESRTKRMIFHFMETKRNPSTRGSLLRAVTWRKKFVA